MKGVPRQCGAVMHRGIWLACRVPWIPQEYPERAKGLKDSYTCSLGDHVGYNGADYSVLVPVGQEQRDSVRHLASFRLHCLDWGTDKERETVPELVAHRCVVACMRWCKGSTGGGVEVGDPRPPPLPPPPDPQNCARGE